MEFNGISAGAEDRFAAGLEELTRGVAALAQNSARPHKQLVQRGAFVYSTGDVQHNIGTAAPRRFSSILTETEHAINLRDYKGAYAMWQDSEPALERSQYEITAKVFVRPTSATLADDVKQVIARACADNKTEYVDAVVIAAPETHSADFDALIDAWAAAEALHAQGLVRKLGVSNVDADRLKALLAQARVKPEIVQVAPSPSPARKELINTARENGIAVFVDSTDADISLTNNNSGPIAQRKFGNAFHNALVPPFSTTSFAPLAIARYTAVHTDRAIVLAKGYAVKTKYTIA